MHHHHQDMHMYKISSNISTHFPANYTPSECLWYSNYTLILITKHTHDQSYLSICLTFDYIWFFLLSLYPKARQNSMIMGIHICWMFSVGYYRHLIGQYVFFLISVTKKLCFLFLMAYNYIHIYSTFIVVVEEGQCYFSLAKYDKNKWVSLKSFTVIRVSKCISHQRKP